MIPISLKNTNPPVVEGTYLAQTDGGFPYLINVVRDYFGEWKYKIPGLGSIPAGDFNPTTRFSDKLEICRES